MKLSVVTGFFSSNDEFRFEIIQLIKTKKNWNLGEKKKSILKTDGSQMNIKKKEQVKRSLISTGRLADWQERIRKKAKYSKPINIIIIIIKSKQKLDYLSLYKCLKRSPTRHTHFVVIFGCCQKWIFSKLTNEIKAENKTRKIVFIVILGETARKNQEIRSQTANFLFLPVCSFCERAWKKSHFFIFLFVD